MQFSTVGLISKQNRLADACCAPRQADVSKTEIPKIEPDDYTFLACGQRTRSD
jgi:hypothetical protein